MENIKKWNEKLNNFCLFFAGLSLMAMLAVACTNMILRLAGRPISAAYELVCYFGAVTVALPLGYTQIKKSHIAVDIVSKTFPPSIRKVAVGISCLLGMAFFCIAAWCVGERAYTLWAAREVSETLRIRYFPFTFGVAVGCGLVALSLLVDFLALLIAPGEEGK